MPFDSASTACLLILSFACIVDAAYARTVTDTATETLPQILARRERTLLQRRRSDAPDEQTAGLCSWDAARSECQVGLSAISDLLGQSDDKFAQLVASLAECAGKQDEEACAATESCVWPKLYNRCLYPYISRGLEDSPCFVNGPLSFALEETLFLCLSHHTQSVCLQDPHCLWNEEENICYHDDVLVIYGTPEKELFGKVDKVMEMMGKELFEGFLYYFNLNDPDFDWEAVLDWKVPEIDCSESVNATVCNIATGMFSSIASTQIYCNFKYPKLSNRRECSENSQCRFERESSTCVPNEDAMRTARLRGIQNTIPSFEGVTDREVLLRRVECAAITDEDECTGDCEFNVGTAAGCTASAETLGTLFAEPGRNGDEALCFYTSLLPDSGCFKNLTPDECRSNSNCTLHGEACEYSPEYVVGEVIKRDRGLQASYRRLRRLCAGYETMEECVAAK